MNKVMTNMMARRMWTLMNRSKRINYADTTLIISAHSHLEHLVPSIPDRSESQDRHGKLWNDTKYSCQDYDMISPTGVDGELQWSTRLACPI